MVEANVQNSFNAWIATHPPEKSSVWELKLEKGKSFAFDKVADHQIDGLQTAKHKGKYHKIADSPFIRSAGKMMRFTKPKPFDCLFVKGPAYVVIVFYEPRRKKIMYWIDVDRFVEERNASDRKSLTEARAEEIAEFKYFL